MSSPASVGIGMHVIRRILTSTVGLKIVMAATGIVLISFLYGHMFGNLQVFLGPEALNAYARRLQSLGPLLWVVRLTLIVCLVAHVSASIKLALGNLAARDRPYGLKNTLAATISSRSMMYTGVALAAFLVYHLGHFTLGLLHPEHAALRGSEWNVYAMVVAGFRSPVVAISYAVLNAAVAVHISHAASSLLQTLGLRVGRTRVVADLLGPALGAGLLVGNCSMPLAVWLGLGPFAQG